ncbi:MAG TPA: glycosyltransferase family 1 protein, partial [Actinomycetota bacterium]|nr:glycosyltransferase family 1 protein [Actinomycetota bacterium]
PVLAADATALPEVVSNAGRLISPDNPDDWCAAMSELLEDEGTRKELGKKGRARGQDFWWDRSAGVLEDAYLHALATTL